MDFVLPKGEMERLSGHISAAQERQLTAYARALLSASSKQNLVSRQSLGQLAEHFVDSAALLAFTEIGGLEVADLGSGGGLPGVVLAVLRPEAYVTLVESRRGKVVFLKSVARLPGFTNLDVLHTRIDEIASDVRFDLAVARALGDVTRLMPDCLKVLAPGGRLVLFKGPQWSAEREAAERVAEQQGFVIGRTEDVELPGLDRATTFVEFHVKQPEEED